MGGGGGVGVGGGGGATKLRWANHDDLALLLYTLGIKKEKWKKNIYFFFIFIKDLLNK